MKKTVNYETKLQKSKRSRRSRILGPSQYLSALRTNPNGVRAGFTGMGIMD